VLSVRGLVKRFGAVTAVDGVSFDVAPGELFTILGPSGCGKTTVLRSIAGLETPEAGEIAIGDELLFSCDRGADVPANQRRLGLVFQSYALWPHMNVFETVAFPLDAAPRRERLSRAAIRARVEEALDVVALAGLADRPATDLSGGQQQRLALARALVSRPRLLLLDEPLSSLDAKLREAMRFELKRLQREAGVAAVYVTHDQAEALAISDRIAVMTAGAIEQVGRPREVYERPASRFVAGFVGVANLIEGVVESRDANGTAAVATSEGTLRASAPATLAAGSRVVVVVRPEHVELRVPGAADADGAWPGTVVASAYAGDAVEHVVAVGPLELRARTEASRILASGTPVQVRLPPEHCLLVSGDSRPGALP
jgi:ABC-type Fe3+/spermidine/putrescine transport system ATPase subunit